MAVLTLAEAKAQLRVTDTAEDSVIQAYIDAAGEWCAQRLNRAIYADQATYDAWLQGIVTAYAAQGVIVTDPALIYPPIQIPVVVNNPIKQACRLLVGHWFENRQASTADEKLQTIPLGVDELLWPYRGSVVVN